MTPAQKDTIFTLVQRLKPSEFHHGCCVGSDYDAHLIASNREIPLVVHPPLDEKKMAVLPLMPRFILRPPKDYLERNRDIVDETEILFATPYEYQERIRSGTWYTIRYANSLEKPTVIVYPDGSKYVLNSESID